jgi:hypothetical protein
MRSVSLFDVPADCLRNYLLSNCVNNNVEWRNETRSF